MAVRRYTGTGDIRGKAANMKQALESMVQTLCYFFNMQKVGTISSSLTSVHASGRAFDIRCLNGTTGVVASSNFEERNWNLINFLYLNRDNLGVEEIHDYVGLYVLSTMVQYDGSGRGHPSKYGAGYRCNRDSTVEYGAPSGWMRWSAESHRSHGGDSVGAKHIHVEMSPASVANEKNLLFKLNAALQKYMKSQYQTISISGLGLDSYCVNTKGFPVTKVPNK
jgi:hypothetical protein